MKKLMLLQNNIEEVYYLTKKDMTQLKKAFSKRKDSNNWHNIYYLCIMHK